MWSRGGQERSEPLHEAPAVSFTYRYFSATNARAAPTAMPRASRAISLAMRCRFTYPLSHKRAGAPHKDTPARLVMGTVLSSNRLGASRTSLCSTASKRPIVRRSSPRVVPVTVSAPVNRVIEERSRIPCPHAPSGAAAPGLTETVVSSVVSPERLPRRGSPSRVRMLEAL